jgi:hypothetical protein
VAGGKVRSMVNLILGEGWWGAHRSGQPTVAQHGRMGNPSMARTEGRRWWTIGRGVPVNHGKAFKRSYVAGGGRRVANDGELHVEEDVVVELSSSNSVAGASSCKRALDPWPEWR